MPLQSYKNHRVSIHGYCPPRKRLSIFSQNTRRSESPVTEVKKKKKKSRDASHLDWETIKPKMKFTLYFFAVLSFAGFALVRGVAKGENCTSATCDTDLFCESNVCKVKAGAACATEVDCITGATCLTDGKCVCGDTMVPKAGNTTCLLKVGENCTTVDGCVEGTTCEGTPTKKCTCPAKSGANTAKDKCEIYLGGQCNTPDDCANPGGSACTANKCVCKTNYTGDENSPCLLKVDQDCSRDAECYGKNAECGAGNPAKCQCKSGFVPDGQYCAKKVGEGCTVNDDCPIHGECREKKCACMGNYEKSDDGLCKSSGSAVVGTALMLLVAFVTSRLL